MEHMSQIERKLLVCYVPGLDMRSISSETTPTIADLIHHHSAVEIRTIPDTELVPTLLSGVYPHQNEIWQVSIDGKSKPTAMQRIVDSLPNLVTTTAQCIRQRFDSGFDLATIPPRRRREFTHHRFKYTRRAAHPDLMKEFNGYKTLFGVLDQNARYRFTYHIDELDVLAHDILASPVQFEFVEMYALDLYQHWHLDEEDGMRAMLKKTDDFVAELRDGCDKNGRTLVLLSDHGQELVTGTIQLVDVLKSVGVPRGEYSYYCELACARLWFHTERARETIVPQLQQLEECKLLHFREMHQYDVRFEDESFGQYYLMADAGRIFFPHDFYQPLANLYFGLFGHSQRKRAISPVHRGNHGYLPHNPSEKGFLVLADAASKPNREQMTLIDFAPTMLAYLGADIPEHMEGQSAV
jgi:hypothetical protein